MRTDDNCGGVWDTYRALFSKSGRAAEAAPEARQPVQNGREYRMQAETWGQRWRLFWRFQGVAWRLLAGREVRLVNRKGEA